jgi:hypothetical protein
MALIDTMSATEEELQNNFENYDACSKISNELPF